MADEERIVTRTEHVHTPEPVYAPPPVTTAATVSQREVTYRDSGNTVLQRLIIFIFGVIQGLLLVRILLLLVAAREGNALVSLIYDISDIFVAPFRGILRLEQIAAGRTEFDVSAVVAIIGWTILEILILGLLRVFRRTA